MFFSVALGVPLIVAMIFIVAAEALVPTGAGPQPVELVLRARRSLAEFTDELSRLQDQAEPAPWEQVEELISRSISPFHGVVFGGMLKNITAAAEQAEQAERAGNTPLPVTR